MGPCLRVTNVFESRTDITVIDMQPVGFRHGDLDTRRIGYFEYLFNSASEIEKAYAFPDL